uniref:Uncharacterized protein n=1 Tax=Mycena chlorophos TaxID=658473 RepID=A0ABQ0LSL7_MYCCL|nr:predicted protein [Mycena chlorophos]
MDSFQQIPKVVDRTAYVQSYVDRQRPHVSSYLSPRKPGSTNTIGFATPILTARVRRSRITTKPRDKENPPNEKIKKRPHDEDDDDDADQTARLAERRERKRAKRAIVEPPSEPAVQSTRKSQRNKKKPENFALMHGFSATNVTKNRLTLKPPSAVGVFKKGKASLNARTKAKSKAKSSQPFSESEFLKGKKQRAVADDLSQSSEAPNSKAAGSVVWDLESAVDEPEIPDLEEERSCSQVQGTIVLDIQRPGWAPSVLSDAPIFPSSPSLRPSESASQVCNRPPRPIVPVSRHFPEPPSYWPVPPRAAADSQKRSVSALQLDDPVVEPRKSPLRFRIPARKRDFSQRFQSRTQHIETCLEEDEAEYDLEGNPQGLQEGDEGMDEDEPIYAPAPAFYDHAAGEEADLDELEDQVQALSHIMLADDEEDPAYVEMETEPDEMEEDEQENYQDADQQEVAEEEHDDDEDNDENENDANPIEFTEGRALLMGLTRTRRGTTAEKDVARKLMRGHWKPQRL